MVVDDLDLGCTRGGPPETDPVLVIDSDGVLTGAIAAQRFQTIARRHSKLFQRERRIQDGELIESPLHQARRQERARSL